MDPPPDIDTWVKVQHGIELDPWQRNLVRSTARRLLLCCSRQSGKSTVISVVAAHFALFNPQKLVLVIAPTLRQSKELFLKIANLLPAKELNENSKTSITLSNGSRIVALPGDGDNVRGFSGVDLLLIDEAAFAADSIFHAVSPMIAVSGGRSMWLSSANGKTGVFYNAFAGGGDDYLRFEVHATECPRLKPEFLAVERRTLGESKYLQEYFCKFGESEDAAFANIDAIMDTSCEMLE